MSIDGKIAVIGGDKRLQYMAQLLHQEKCCIRTYRLEEGDIDAAESLEEALKDATIIIGPIPFSRDGLHILTKEEFTITICDFIAGMKENQILFAGSISAKIKQELEEKQVKVYDFMELEDVAVKNAVATAEGTIAEAISISDKNLYKSECLVLGYGKCAKALAHRLKGLGAYVTVAARKQEQRLQAGVQGHHMLHTDDLAKELAKFDFIFNTVPAMMLEKDKIKLLKKEAVIIDIASKPGGTDFKACEKCGIHAALALGLPGKYSPKTSAEILIDAMRHLLSDSCLGV